jgi:hypothetical protein
MSDLLSQFFSKSKNQVSNKNPKNFEFIICALAPPNLDALALINLVVGD